MSRPDEYAAIAAVSPELVLVDPELGALARALLPFPSDCLAPKLRPRSAVAGAPAATAAAVRPAPAPVVVERRDEPHSRRRPSVAAVVGGLFALLVIGSPALDLLPGIGAEPPRVMSVEETKTSAPTGRRAEPLEAAPTTAPRTPVRSTVPKRTSGSETSRSSTTGTAKPKQATTERRVTKPRGSKPKPASVATPKNEAPGVRLEWPPSKGADLYNVIFWGKGKRVKDLWVNKASVVVGGSPGTTSASLPPGTYRWFAFPGYRNGKRVSYGALAGSGSVRLERQS